MLVPEPEPEAWGEAGAVMKALAAAVVVLLHLTGELNFGHRSTAGEEPHTAYLALRDVTRLSADCHSSAEVGLQNHDAEVCIGLVENVVIECTVESRLRVSDHNYQNVDEVRFHSCFSHVK